MRHLAIGDIHGCYRALATLAEAVPFRPTDVLVTLGDYVDRGPDSRAVLEWVIRRHREGRLVPLRGNHEIMMLAARAGGQPLDDWLAVGGGATLASYAPPDGPGRPADVPDEHWAFLENDLRPYHETDTHLFVHAGAYPELPLAEQPDFMLYWEQFDDPPPHGSGKVLVCGHTSQHTGDPRTIGHAVCIDTWAYGRGWLTCLDVGSGQYWKADQSGRVRGGWMSDLE